jgi:hypothetical protein
MKVTIFFRIIIFFSFFSQLLFTPGRDVIEIRYGNKTRTFFYCTWTFFGKRSSRVFAFLFHV